MASSWYIGLLIGFSEFLKMICRYEHARPGDYIEISKISQWILFSDHFSALRNLWEIFCSLKSTSEWKWDQFRISENDPVLTTRKLLPLGVKIGLSLTSFVPRFHSPTRDPRHVVRLGRTTHRECKRLTTSDGKV